MQQVCARDGEARCRMNDGGMCYDFKNSWVDSSFGSDMAVPRIALDASDTTLQS